MTDASPANAGERKTGTVKFFNPAKGYGFIEGDDGGADIFVHLTAILQFGQLLMEGMRVSYILKPDRDGRGPRAIDLALASSTASNMANRAQTRR